MFLIHCAKLDLVNFMHVILTLTLFYSTLAFGHSGRTDSKGGHFNRSTGQYHFHGKLSSSETPRSNSQSFTSPAYQPVPQNPISKNLTHWLSLNSNKRHNTSCRYFKKSRGRLCGPLEGIACKLCELNKSYTYSPKLSSGTPPMQSYSISKKKENGSMIPFLIIILGILLAVYFWKKKNASPAE